MLHADVTVYHIKRARSAVVYTLLYRVVVEV